MQSWTIIDSRTGEVVYPCYNTEDDQHPVDDGFVAEPYHEFIPIDTMPDPALHQWTGEGWEASIDILRRRKNNEVNALKLATESAGAGTSIGVVDSDMDSRGKINGLALMALLAQTVGDPFELTFRKQDDTYHHFTEPLSFIEFAKQVGMHSVRCHYRAVALKKLVDESDDPASIDVVQAWNAGQV